MEGNYWRKDLFGNAGRIFLFLWREGGGLRGEILWNFRVRLSVWVTQLERPKDSVKRPEGHLAGPLDFQSCTLQLSYIFHMGDFCICICICILCTDAGKILSVQDECFALFYIFTRRCLWGRVKFM